MAGKPVGVAYAQIDLDSTKLEQGLKRTHDALISGSIKVEDSYKSLGIKSDQVYNMMRANAVAAVDFIKNKTLSSKEEIIRAEQAAANKIKSINEQQFGKQTSFIDSLKQHWVAASAAIVAAWMLVNKAIAYMDVGAKALQVESSFKIMADAAGVNAESMIASMKKATKETIEDSDLMQKAVKLMTLGYNPEQIERFSKVVITASQIAGTTATEAYEGLADAIANRMPKALVRMGAVTREQMKIVNEAITAGADTTALYELAMANLELKQLMLQGTQDAATISLQRFHAQQKETGESIGQFLIIALQKAYGVMQMFAAGALGAAGALYSFLAATVSISVWVSEKSAFTEKAKAHAAALREYAESTKKTAEILSGAAQELAAKGAANISGLAELGAKATQQQIADSKAKIDAQMKELAAFKDTEAAAKKALQEREAAEKAIIEIIRKAQIEIDSAHQSQYTKDMIRIDSEVEKYRKLEIDETLITQFAESEKTVAKEKARLKWIELNKLNLIDESDTLVQETLMHQESADKTKAIWDATYGYDKKKLDEYLANHMQGMETRMDEITALGDYGNVAEANNARIAAHWAMERAKWILGINKSMADDIAKFTGNEVKLKIDAIEEEYRIRKLRMGDSILLEKWREIEIKKIREKEALEGDDFWAGLAAARDKYYREEDKAGKLAANLYGDYVSRKKQFSDEFVTNFIAGQDLMLSIQQAAGNMAVGLAGDISKRMWAAAIDKIIGMIGAYIGGGAASTAFWGAQKGGVAGALTEIGLYLGTAVAAMLAGRGMAQKFKTEGGWVATHPGGGWVQEGSGNRDDVFLGYTPGVRHWGMGGEYVVNKQSSARHAPLLEAINRDRGWDEGGPIADWKPVSQALGMGCGLSFLHGFYKGGFWPAIMEAITFNATAIPSMFAGKFMGDQFKADGGWLDVGHGWGSFFSGLINPFHGISSWLSDQFRWTIQNIPGIGQYIPNPFKLAEIFTDPEEAKRVLMDLIAGPYEQIAKDVITPGKYWSDPIDTVTSNITNLGKVWKEFTGAKLPFFHSGIDFVPQSGPAYLERGERVVSKQENSRPINITLELNGRVLSKFIYNETKSGNKMIHPRGMANA